MKYLLKSLTETNEVLKAIDTIDEEYFGSLDSDSEYRIAFKDNQIGYFEKDYYFDEYTFHPYTNQEEMKAIYKVLNLLRKDFSERSIELHQKAIDILKASINELKESYV